MTDNELTHTIIAAAIDVHRALGPGLVEAIYEECLAREFTLRGLSYERQRALPVVYKHEKLEAGYRADFLVANRVIVEIKAVDAVAPVHEAIVLTYFAPVRLPARPADQLSCRPPQGWNSALHQWVRPNLGETQRHGEAQRSQRQHG